MRIELTYLAWEASVLPLNYTREFFAKRKIRPASATNRSAAGAKLKFHQPLKFLVSFLNELFVQLEYALKAEILNVV